MVRVGPAAVGERVLRALPDTTAAQIVAAMPAEHARHWRRRLARPRARRFLRSHRLAAPRVTRRRGLASAG